MEYINHNDDNDYSEDDSNFSITEELDEGTYYIWFHGYNPKAFEASFHVEART